MLKSFMMMLAVTVGVLVVVALSAPTGQVGNSPTWLQLNMPLLIVVVLIVVVLIVVLALVRSSNNTIQQISALHATTTRKALDTVVALNTSQQQVLRECVQLGWELRGLQLLPPPAVNEKPIKLQTIEAEYVREIL